MEPDLEEMIKRDTKIVNLADDDGDGAWYVVKKNTDLRAAKEDGTPIIVMSHETAYRIGFNIGLYDCLWWCPILVGDYEQKYGVDKEE